MDAGILDAYRVRVAGVFRSTAGDSVFNGTLDHARIVTEEAFNAADSCVRLLMNRAPSRQFDCDEVVGAVEQFLDKPGARLQVLFERDFDASASAFARCALKGRQDNVEIRQVPEAIQTRYPFNFLTVDSRSYRFQEDRKTPVAIVASGDKHAAAAQNLENIFAQLWDMSVPVEAGPHAAPAG